VIIPDYFEPLVGWRAWGSVSPEGYLKALTRSFYWVPGKAVQVRCDLCGGPAKPTMTNHAGLHAFKTVKQLLDDHAHVGTIIGQVYLWGTVVECERGYRAEYAYPKALIANNKWQEELLSTAWKIPVEVANITQLYNTARAVAFRRLEQEGRL
jgi:hypothetical protein